MWVVGIDEAGYGPNLGPLIQTAVAVHVRDGDPDLWNRLSAIACRAADKTPADRLVIDDSKAVYRGNNALAQLERTVWCVFGHLFDGEIRGLIDVLASAVSQSDLIAERWFDPTERMPATTERDVLISIARQWSDAINSEGIRIDTPRCEITPTTRFNEVLREHGSKGAVTGRGVASLITDLVGRLGEEPVFFVIDKLGGRNVYAPMLQTALPDCWITTVQESGPVSEYRTELKGRLLRFQFKPRAEAEAMPVALASMLSKYLRELLMRQFNRYWQSHMPGVKPTAGYPVDARRFFADIQPAIRRLGLCHDAVWRMR